MLETSDADDKPPTCVSLWGESLRARRPRAANLPPKAERFAVSRILTIRRKFSGCKHLGFFFNFLRLRDNLGG